MRESETKRGDGVRLKSDGDIADERVIERDRETEREVVYRTEERKVGEGGLRDRERDRERG